MVKIMQANLNHGIIVRPKTESHVTVAGVGKDAGYIDLDISIGPVGTWCIWLKLPDGSLKEINIGSTGELNEKVYPA